MQIKFFLKIFLLGVWQQTLTITDGKNHSKTYITTFLPFLLHENLDAEHTTLSISRSKKIQGQKVVKTAAPYFFNWWLITQRLLFIIFDEQFQWEELYLNFCICMCVCTHARGMYASNTRIPPPHRWYWVVKGFQKDIFHIPFVKQFCVALNMLVGSSLKMFFKLHYNNFHLWRCAYRLSLNDSTRKKVWAQQCMCWQRVK